MSDRMSKSLSEPCFSTVDSGASVAASDVLELPFEGRQRVRQRVVLASGAPVVLMLPRGTILRGGDRLRDEQGNVIVVRAAPEPVSTVRIGDARALARIAYHLGNRHLWVEVGDGWLRYQQDAVIDRMVAGLGGRPEHESAPFEPEAGAYGDSHGHSHGHAHEHAHEHAHAREAD